MAIVESKLEVVQKEGTFVSNEKGEQVQLYDVMEKDYLRIQQAMNSGQFNPEDLEMMTKIMQYANLPEAWRVVSKEHKDRVSENREKIASVMKIKKKEKKEEEISDNDKKNMLIDNAVKELGVTKKQYAQLLSMAGIPYRLHDNEDMDVNDEEKGRIMLAPRINESKITSAIKWISNQGFKIHGNNISVENLDFSTIKGEVQLPEHLIVLNNLNLSGMNISSIPSALTVHGDLTLSNTNVAEIGQLLYVKGDLELNNCPDLQKIGTNSIVDGNLICVECYSLYKFPSRKLLTVKKNIIGDKIAAYIAEQLGFIAPKKRLFGKKDDDLLRHKFIPYKNTVDENDTKSVRSENKADSSGYLIIPRELGRGNRGNENVIV